jgi:hypothetical protein
MADGDNDSQYFLKPLESVFLVDMPVNLAVAIEKDERPYRQ